MGKFRSELSESWSESTKGEDGLHHLTVEDWELEVFNILLNILHLRNRQVPPSLTLETLDKMAGCAIGKNQGSIPRCIIY